METRSPLEKPRGTAAALSPWRFTAAICFVLTGVGLPDARGQEVLRWKFREGDVLKYTHEQTTNMTVKVSGRERKQKRSVSTTYSWSIKAVSDAGDADITHASSG